MDSQKTVAVVEDNKDNRLLIRAILSDFYEITEYASAYEALDGLKASVPDLIILDISLPGMDGVELLGHLRSDVRLRKLPVIALTAHAMTGDRERYLSSGFDDYIAKPIVDDEVLLSSIDRLFSDSSR
ncbi:MAG: response regulator [Ignavibacteriales bacterium]|nr:response regulator [Ignavibacteriales bacterium]